MKKVILALTIVSMLLLSGCIKSNDPIGQNIIYLQGSKPRIVYDSRTEIVYYYNNNSYGHVLTPFYGKDKQLMTKDEFIELYGERR